MNASLETPQPRQINGVDSWAPLWKAGTAQRQQAAAARQRGIRVMSVFLGERSDHTPPNQCYFARAEDSIIIQRVICGAGQGGAVFDMANGSTYAAPPGQAIIS